MIDELIVKNLALIAEAHVSFSSGLTVFTGETGAGKTALLHALKLLVGQRADTGMIREGASSLEVQGRFFGATYDDQPDDDQEDADQADDDAAADQVQDEGLVVSRRFTTEGRGRASIDDRMASVSELQRRIAPLVDICSQHEHQRLLERETHAALLDSWIGAPMIAAKQSYREAFLAARSAAAELARITQLVEDAASKRDEATYTLNELGKLNPKPGELEELDARLPLLQHADALLRQTTAALDHLQGDDAARDMLARTIAELEQATRYDQALQPLLERLLQTQLELEDISLELSAYADTLDIDEYEIDRLFERKEAIDAALRRFGPTFEDLFVARKAAEEILAAEGSKEIWIQDATAAVTVAEQTLAKTAKDIQQLRQDAAPSFALAINHELAALHMGTAEVVFDVHELSRDQWSETSASRVECLYRPAQDLTARPLRKIASGGEISRVMLALKVVLGERDATGTLVFDEVDAGVGGSAARALADALVKLAKTHQVIVVTHLPQIACWADTHYLVQKRDPQDPHTSLTELEAQERVREIARMLSGDLSETSLLHAQELLSQAHKIPTHQAK